VRGGSDMRGGGDMRGGYDRKPIVEKDDPNSPYKFADYEVLLNRNLFSRYKPRKQGDIDPEEADRLQALRDARAAEDARRFSKPNYDKDIVLMGIVDRDGVTTGVLEDRHANKTIFVKAGENLGTGKVNAISIDALDYTDGKNKTLKIAYGRNLEGGFSEAKPIDPPQWRKGDMPGEEGLSLEERMKRKRMREMGIPVPEIKPQSADSNDNQQDENLSPEERYKRAFQQRFQDGNAPQWPGFGNQNFQNFQGFDQNQDGNSQNNQGQNQGDRRDFQPQDRRQDFQRQDFQRQDFQRQDRRQDFQPQDRRQDYQQPQREFPQRRQDTTQQDPRQDYQPQDRRQDAQPADAPASPAEILSIEERMKRKRALENGDAAPPDAPKTNTKTNVDDPNLTPEERLRLKRQKELNPDF
jgi:hypothetical protein